MLIICTACTDVPPNSQKLSIGPIPFTLSTASHARATALSVAVGASIERRHQGEQTKESDLHLPLLLHGRGAARLLGEAVAGD